MDADTVAILIGIAGAGITSTAGIIVALIRTRRSLHADHAASSATLTRIDKTTSRIDRRLDSHLEWHAENPPKSLK